MMNFEVGVGKQCFYLLACEVSSECISAAKFFFLSVVVTVTHLH